MQLKPRFAEEDRKRPPDPPAWETLDAEARAEAPLLQSTGHRLVPRQRRRLHLWPRAHHDPAQACRG
ncbi:hypothetical protein, partial [Mesorhizobium sp. M0195]|uniref:hypothetical protein n=1 Tax=Mesorhizobium sp. M0195 TaxID=2956910 RepID=UPI00333887AD